MKTKTAKSTKKNNVATKTAVVLKRYAGKAIKVLNNEITAKPGSWRRFMLDAICGSKTTDQAQQKINGNKKFAGRHAHFAWAEEHGYVKILKAKKAA